MSWSCGRAFLETLVHCVPVDVREKRFDVFRALRRFVIQKESVLPHVHYQDGREARDIANLVQRNPVIGQSAVSWILIANSPADATHLANADEVRSPDVVTSETLLRCLPKGGSLARLAGTRLHHVVEVVLVEDHAVVFKPQ